MKQSIIAISTIVLLTSCGQSTAPKEVEEATPKAEETMDPKSCEYSFNVDSTLVTWTAFKTTEKIGVGGQFDVINVSGTQAATTAEEVFTGASFEIPVSSINTNNPDRDMKIQKFFFGSLTGSEMLSGRLVALSANFAEVAISMNGVEKNVNMDYSMDGDAILLETTINVGEWNAQAGVDALNKECYELHMAGDGVSKLWPEVKIGIRSVLDKTCE
jgi:polyisoprenoid-binding protein YceI